MQTNQLMADDILKGYDTHCRTSHECLSLLNQRQVYVFKQRVQGNKNINGFPTNVRVMMTSSNGNIFRVTGHLCGEFIGHRWIPHTKAGDAELWCFLWSALNKRLSKQSRGWWFETPLRLLWRHCNVQRGKRFMSCHDFIMLILSSCRYLTYKAGRTKRTSPLCLCAPIYITKDTCYRSKPCGSPVPSHMQCRGPLIPNIAARVILSYLYALYILAAARHT